jgi:cold shock CspA family protein
MKNLLSFNEYINESEFISESEVDPRVKREAISRLSQFFRVNASSLNKFRFDGTDDVRELTKVLNSASYEGTDAYYKVAIQLAKDEFGIHESEVNEAKDAFVNATIIQNDGDLKKGDMVKVNALQYTQGGDNDKISIIRGDGKKADILKKNLSVKI